MSKIRDLSITCGDKMKIAFVIPCKNSKKTTPFLQKCVSSIRFNYPEQDIHIVDSDSEFKESARKISDQNKVYYHEIKNKNFSTGALWYVYDKFESKYDYYFLIHDSTETLHPVDNISNISVSPVMYSYDWLWPRIDTTKSERSSKFAEDQFKKNNLSLPEKWPMMLGPMFLVRADILKKIKQTNFYNIRPSNKYESECMERLWPAMFCNMGYEDDIVTSSISGKTDDDIGRDTILQYGVPVKVKKTIGNDKVIKYWIKRQ